MFNKFSVNPKNFIGWQFAVTHWNWIAFILHSEKSQTVKANQQKYHTVKANQQKYHTVKVNCQKSSC